MRFAIVYSIKDTAGMNIVEQLKQIGFLPQFPIIELNKETIYSNDLNSKNYPELNEIDFIVFASKHRSEKGNPSLSLHAPGNWRGADFGGFPGKVCKTSAFVLKYLFWELNKNAEIDKLTDKYTITLEVTHHGPLIEIPCCFIELGSNEKDWEDKKAARTLAKTILSLQTYKPAENWIPCIGIGGPHYCPNFNKIQLNSNYAISHIIPEYNFPITMPMLKEAEQKTTEQIKEVIMDWKGCGKTEERQFALEVIKKAGLNTKRTNEVEKTNI
jgi:D-aminoacyl-tRNA deacylase